MLVELPMYVFVVDIIDCIIIADKVRLVTTFNLQQLIIDLSNGTIVEPLHSPFP